MKIFIKNSIYEIVNNTAEQAIMVIDDIQTNSDLSEFPVDTVNAIYLNVPDEIAAMFLFTFRRSQSTRHYLKPIFLSASSKMKVKNLWLADGRYESFNAADLSDKVTRINNVVNQMVDDDSQEYDTFELIGLRILRFFLSRGTDIEMKPDPSSFIGYSNQMFALYSYNNNSYIYDLLLVMDSLEKKKYIEKTFHDQIHVCPDCGCSHLNFRESCPKCGSAHLNMEGMIHHFECAYVGPEREYIVGNELVCPKCSKNLRHIGVDYDRPTVAYNCNTCNFFFQTPLMKAYCFSCVKENMPEALKSKTIHNYKITAMGQDVAIQGRMDHIEIEDTETFAGFITYELYKSYIDVEILRLQNNSQESLVVFSLQLQTVSTMFLDDINLREVTAKIANLLTNSENRAAIYAFKNNVFLGGFLNKTEYEVNNMLTELRDEIVQSLQRDVPDLKADLKMKTLHISANSLSDEILVHLLTF